ncbi:RCC1 domain-containing protein RUG3, mitochondrial isoform X2 [Capsicum annuum]|uniref:RCC1 domain-containing protein RUG3, mitochondrial isoform X2 n=1 Tax=Capsicum annuum TaxID=4072 RepID=UPI0007BF1181|nr:RCC1 domain-containing protein RUG3, mitochondrial isoform X2 [Capsicum annuum]
MAFYYRTYRPLPICLWRRYLSSSSSFSSKIPLLWDSKSTDSVNVQLYSWGRGASGQLGGGIEEIRIYPSPIASFSLSPNFQLSSPIPGRLPSDDGQAVDVEIGISCGLFHSALLVDGNLWIWGKGDGGRLGFGHENPVFVPTLNEHLDSVTSVALGGLHSVALNSLGQVFTWGYGGFGALGHRVYHRELVPRLVEGSWDAEICHVATSGTHTAAITKSANSNYELGRGDKLSGWKPQLVPSLKGVRVTQIASGGYHSLALTDKGEVLSWGHGGHGQLGTSSLQNQKVPIPVEALAHEKVVYIACGGSSSAAITDGGKLYMWGYAKDCQLGVPGLPEKQSSPIEVKFLMEDDGLGNHNVLSLAIGASHAMCLVSRSGY